MQKRTVILSGVLAAVIAAGGYVYIREVRTPRLHPLFQELYSVTDDEQAIPWSCIQDISQTAEMDGGTVTVHQTVTYDNYLGILLEVDFPEEWLTEQEEESGKAAPAQISLYEIVHGEDGTQEQKRVASRGGSSHQKYPDQGEGTSALYLGYDHDRDIFYDGMELCLSIESLSAGSEKVWELSEPVELCWTVEAPGESVEMELDCEAFTGKMILNPFYFNLVLWDAPYTREELEDVVQLLDEKGEPVRLPGSGGGGEGSSGYVSMRRTGGTPMDVEHIRQLKIGDQVFELSAGLPGR